MISRFFIDRPIFASVLSIIITLAGAIAMWALPIAQYPPIAPPTVQVSCTYPGASAQVVADTVAAPIEQQVNGVEGMLYMSSQMGNDGSYTLTVTFDIGTGSGRICMPGRSCWRPPATTRSSACSPRTTRRPSSSSGPVVMRRYWALLSASRT